MMRHKDFFILRFAKISRCRKLCLLVMPVLLFVASCSMLPVSDTPTTESYPGQVLFLDDFSDLGSGWKTWHDDDGSLIDYQNGGLRFVVNKPESDYLSTQNIVFTNVQLEVEAIKINGPDDNQFGLICRYQDSADYYAFVLTSDGYYGILKVVEGQYHLLSGESLHYSESIRQGMAINLIRADCVGNTLTLYANDQEMVSVKDTEYNEGQVGLLVVAYESAGVDILFDQFKVIKP